MPGTLENQICWGFRGEMKRAQGLTLIPSEKLPQSTEGSMGTHLVKLDATTWQSAGENILLSSPNFIHPGNIKWFRNSLFIVNSLVDILPCVKEAVWWTWNYKGEILHIIWWWCTSGYLMLAQCNCTVYL